VTLVPVVKIECLVVKTPVTLVPVDTHKRTLIFPPARAHSRALSCTIGTRTGKTAASMTNLAHVSVSTSSTVSVSAVAAGGSHTCVILADSGGTDAGKVKCFGMTYLESQNIKSSYSLMSHHLMSHHLMSHHLIFCVVKCFGMPCLE
jgi:hypothetical protein